jgi:hypothetical protein
LSERLLARVDVDDYLQDVLPEQAVGLAGPLATVVERFTHEAALRAVSSPAFERTWSAANRAAHQRLVNVLTGDGPVVSRLAGGSVTVSLAGVAGAVQEQLHDAGLTVLDSVPVEEIDGEVTVFRSDALYKARNAVGTLETLALVLPVLSLGLLGGAIALAADRQRTFIKASVALALGVGLLAVLLSWARGFYLDALPESVPEDAATSFYDTLTRSLHTSVRSCLLVSAVVALAAFIAGPGRSAASLRSRWAGLVERVGTSADSTQQRVLAGRAAVSDRRRGLRVAIAVLVLAVALRWPYPTPLVLLLLALAGVVGLFLVDFFGRPPVELAPPAV